MTLGPRRVVRRPPYVETASFAQHGTLSPQLVVLHSTEGGTPHSVVNTLHGKGYGVQWIVGSNGGIIRGTPDRDLWHCGDYNSRSIGIEQCGFAAWTHAQWMEHPNELLASAWIIAWETQRHGLPIEFVAPSVPGSARGVTTHSLLGKRGGGHHDPGAGYPIDHVLGMARSIVERDLGLIERAHIAWACRHVA